MVKGVLVPARVTHPIEAREFERLEDYQAGVGGLIEAVDIPRLGTSVFVNEEGRLRGLEFNSRATFLWWYHVPESRQQAMLVGDAVLVGLPDQAGDSTDLPNEVLALSTQAGRFWLECRVNSVNPWEPIGDLSTYDDYFEAIVWGMIFAERVQPYALKVVGRLGGEVAQVEHEVGPPLP